MIVASGRDPVLRTLLRSHPFVDEVLESDRAGLSLRLNGWDRRIEIGDPSVSLYGLMELMDNNPVVCGDAISVPSPAGTLALIALGPVASAGILVERPSLILSIDAEEEDLGQALRTAGWGDGVNVHVERQTLGRVAVASALAVIQSPESSEEIQGLYEERFGHSFFVRTAAEAEWEPALASGGPRAFYRLEVVPDEPNSFLSVKVMADLDGKCGAAQIVHAMNMMCGFEESLGIA